ncbi:MAG TPA: serine hydrolase [Armatimonadota bacterium]|jgi:beta-lactamase class A
MTIADLKQSLDALAEKIPGRVAYAFEHPASGARVERAPDEQFISASVIKTPILMEAFRQAKAGQIDWEEILPLRDEDKVGGSGVLNVLHAGLPLTARDVAVLMTVVSDNTATNIMIERLGVVNVNKFITDHGLSVTRCVRKLYDMPLIEKGIHNYIAAGEINYLLTLAGDGRLNGPEWDADLIGMMKKQQYREKIPHLLPPDAVTATKSGSLDEVSHDCGIIYLPNGDWFALTICFGDLKGREDDTNRDAANLIMAMMALACYRYVAETI